MAISESDYLHLHKGHTTLLLLRGPAHFHCVVQFPDETYKAFSLPRRDYLAISEGSEVAVKYHTGAFQIPYCTVEPMK